jgi:hypothetical protein
LARGYSRKDLNVSFLRGQKIILQTKVDSVKEQTKDFIEVCSIVKKELSRKIKDFPRDLGFALGK